MARLPSFLPPEIKRRPNLPGVRRSNVRLRGRVSPGAVPGGLAAGSSPAPGLEPFGGVERGTPQQRSDLTARTAALQRNALITPPSSFLGPGPGAPSPIGAGGNIGQLGPNTGGALLGDRIGTVSASSTRGLGGAAPPEAPGFVTPRNILAAQQGRGVQFPGPGEGFGSLDAEGIRLRNLDPRTGRPNPILPGDTVPFAPFNTSQDFFAAKSLRRQFENFTNGPQGPRNTIPIDQARLRAAGQPFQGAQPAGVGGVPGGVAAPPPPSGAVQPLVAGAQVQQQQQPTVGGQGGFNLGLAENQALFEALRQAFMRSLLPQGIGGLAA